MQPSKHQSGTYVLHVGTGREDATIALMEWFVPKGLYDEVYVPRFQKRIRRAGEWRTVEATLVPGYLFVQADDVEALHLALRSVPAFTRILDVGSRFVPLGPEEVTWLDQLTHPGERTVGFSEGYIEGDRIVVTNGPLRGHESRIVKIDRRKRFAYLSFFIMGREKLVKVGLEIVRKV